MNLTSASFVPLALLRGLTYGPPQKSTSDNRPSQTGFSFYYASTSSFDREVLEKYDSDSEKYVSLKNAVDLLIEQKSFELMQSLKDILDDIEDEAEDSSCFIDFVKSNSNSSFFEVAVVRFFERAGNEQKKLDFLNILLSSNVNIFCTWYKNAL